MSAKVAVAGAGIYGSTIAIRLAEQGHQVRLFDPLGVLRAASAINQYRIHSGYHYPRSPETIAEILEARSDFTRAYAPAIVRNSRHYYAIPRNGSQTAPSAYERIMAKYGLVCKPCRPEWIDFEFIETCYEVDEQIYDPEVLRSLIEARLKELQVPLEQRVFPAETRPAYDFVIWATYGLGAGRGAFKMAKYQVAEKILIELPSVLRGVSLVVVDGPFTAFDPYGSSARSLFGSAKNTNHWTTTDPDEPVPEPYTSLLNRPAFEPIPFSRFDAMRQDSALAVPASLDARYLGSRFTMRVVEDNPKQDRRTLYVQQGPPGELYVFSGKVVSAVKAAQIVCDRVGRGQASS